MILARFADLAALRAAEARARAAPGMRVEIFLPHELPEAGPAAAASWIPLAILLAGLGGAAGFFLLQAYAQVYSYPMNVGGRPDFSWPVYVPNAVEVGILLAILTGFVCFLVAAGLPRLYAPVDRFVGLREASRSGYLLLVEAEDGAAARALVEGLRPQRLEEMA